LRGFMIRAPEGWYRFAAALAPTRPGRQPVRLAAWIGCADAAVARQGQSAAGGAARHSSLMRHVTAGAGQVRTQCDSNGEAQVRGHPGSGALRAPLKM
jgi:hypothetical protein